ncbi:BTAD domain-containing putative transcriptional regulator [Planotetraspora sp. GP83]|uniref:AfsR/SARP family transcriptional regulator n=1 Tax=Planotetraspora sp. GP83 TaxID=3156264 RepID=UPI0035130ACB
MRFRVLGTLEVRSDSHRLVRLGAAKQRALLAVLLLNVNRPVSADRLVDALWPQRPPRTAAVALRTYVSTLRQVLGLADRTGPPLLSTVPSGYQLRVSTADLDLLTFEELAAQGQQALTDGQPLLAAERLRRALALWRGRPFEDVALDPRLGVELIRLEERRLAAQETWIESQLALGHHGDVLAELGALVAEQPLRERLQAHWMLALYRSGRQAEALRAYRDLRRHLVQELGIEPSPPLQRLHRQILNGHADLAPPAGVGGVHPGPPVVPRQLPRDIGSFTGRVAELAYLRALADQADGAERPDRTDRSGAPMISAIDGMAGIGKTTLAVHAAHRLADRFADGQLFVDLHGFTQGVSPVDPVDALDQMLRALGVPGEQIPHELDARAALYRTRLAGRRVLILLDNAAEEAQVKPLLPGAPGSLVLITSRRRLTGLEDVRPLSLDVLPRADALDLFSRTAGEQRLAGQPPGLLSEIVELCGRLPLAIRIAGARLRARPGWTLAHLAHRLRDHRHRLGELEVGRLSVTATMDLSYHHLSPERQDMYRLLGLHPGSDFERYAAAALAGTTLQHASRLLDDLVDAHLLQEPVPGRYRFHDLLRTHATATLADEDTDGDRRTALTRLFDHYIQTASAAMEIAHPYEAAGRPPRVREPGGLIPVLGDQASAVEWLDAELTNLLATAVHAARHGWPAHALHLSATLHRHLHTGAHYTYVRTLHSNALHAARALGNRAREVAALCGLGDVHITLGQFSPAAQYFERALEITHATLDREGEITALCGLGHVRRAQGHFGRAAEYFQRALQIAHATGDRDGELNALCGLGRVHRHKRRYGEAADHFERALRIARATGNRVGELRALTGLGFTHLVRGEHRPATDYYQRTLKIARQIGDRNSQFEGLYGLGWIHQATGHPDEALTHHQAALDIARDLGHPADQARALHGLARAHRDLGRHEKARKQWQRALDILTGLGVPEAEDTSTEEIYAHLGDT